MRFLGRIIFHALTLFSLLLCIGAAGLWVRSYSAQEQAAFINTTRKTRFKFESSRGTLKLSITTLLDQAHWSGPRFLHRRINAAPPPQSLSANGTPTLQVVGLSLGPERRRTFQCRWWAVLAISSLLPLRWLPILRTRRRRARWLASGRCPSCGYDLRATPGRCPECGALHPSTNQPTHSRSINPVGSARRTIPPTAPTT